VAQIEADLGADALAKLLADKSLKKPAALERIWQQFTQHGNETAYLTHLIDTVGLTAKQIDLMSRPGRLGVAAGKELSRRIQAVIDGGIAGGRLRELEGRILKSKDNTGHVGELAALERWKLEGAKRARLLPEIEDGHKNPEAIVDGRLKEVKTTRDGVDATWLEKKLGDGSKKAHGHAGRTTGASKAKTTLDLEVQVVLKPGQTLDFAAVDATVRAQFRAGNHTGVGRVRIVALDARFQNPQLIGQWTRGPDGVISGTKGGTP
ncbi:MAG: hypothetical protein ACI9OJ_002745, partial [Myxococcota bacterium]